jgi:hypothetical protein
MEESRKWAMGIDTQGDSISFSLQGNVWVASPESGGLEQSEMETSWQRDSQREGGLMDSIEILPLL